MENVFMKNIANFLDFANHHANATHKDIEKLCDAVKKYRFNAAFVNPCYIAYAKEQLQGKSKVGTVISFPLGQEIFAIKIASVKEAANAGADEIDVSLNVGSIKEAKWEELLHTMTEIITTARTINQNIIIKFIPETGYLTDREIQKTAEIMVASGADFFKTCSGMGPRNAIVEDVKLVRAAVGSSIKIKVAGGISTYQQACAFIESGADRIGTSHAPEIVEEKETPAQKESFSKSE